MNNKKEYGMALVFTLMMVTLVLLFVLLLLNQLLNTNKQISTMEKQIISEQIAQMGVDYYQTYTKAYLPDVISDRNEVTLPDIGPDMGKKDLDTEGDFNFRIESHRIDKTDDPLEIHFTIIGEAYGVPTSIESTIVINID